MEYSSINKHINFYTIFQICHHINFLILNYLSICLVIIILIKKTVSMNTIVPIIEILPISETVSFLLPRYSIFILYAYLTKVITWDISPSNPNINE